MIVKYLSKFVLEVLPSVVATIIGAYIVNHYIVAKPAADAPVAAAVSTVDPRKADTKSTEAAAEPASQQESGQAQKTAADKAAAEKSAERPTETASLPAETRRRLPLAREKTATKPSVPTAATASVIVPAETSPAEAERRDANDMARAAIERLRGSSPAEAPRATEAPRTNEASRATETPSRTASVPPQPVAPLPPPIAVASPSGDGFNPQPRPPYVPVVRVDDPLRPTPPADIPASKPMDLHAEATTGSTQGRTTVADDVLSAAKSVFHAVLPQ
jgi:hypothetical protein